MGRPWTVLEQFVDSLLSVDGQLTGFPWGVRGVSVDGTVLGVSMDSPWSVHGQSIGFPWTVRAQPMKGA